MFGGVLWIELLLCWCEVLVIGVANGLLIQWNAQLSDGSLNFRSRYAIRVVSGQQGLYFWVAGVLGTFGTSSGASDASDGRAKKIRTVTFGSVACR